MASTTYSKKCTSCGGNQWKYDKEQKVWICQYCGGLVERQEQYDGLYTIKNVVRQVVLDSAYHQMDQADRNLSECMKINARYPGTLVAAICCRTIAYTSGKTLSGQDPRSLIGKIERDYRDLQEESGSLGDDETELYQFMDSTDCWAVLAMVFDTLGDQARRDYLLTLVEPEKSFSQETNKVLIRFALNNERIELAQAILSKPDNVDIPNALSAVLDVCPDCEIKGQMAASLLTSGALKPGQEDIVEEYLGGGDSSLTKSSVAAAALAAGLNIHLDILLREVMAQAEPEQFGEILDGLFRRRLFDAEIEQLLGFAANQQDSQRCMTIIQAITKSGRFVSLTPRQAQEFLFASAAPVAQRLEILSALRKFASGDRMWEIVAGTYLCQGREEPEARTALLDALCEGIASVPAKDFETYVLTVPFDGELKPERIKKLLEMKGMNAGFFRELAGKYLQGSRDDPEHRGEILRQLMESGLTIDGAVLVDYVCNSGQTPESKVELVQMALKNGTVLRADALSIYLERCADKFEPMLFALLYRSASSVTQKALSNYVLKCQDSPAVKVKNAAALARHTGMSLGSGECHIRHLGNKVACSLAQAYLLLTRDDIRLASEMVQAMVDSGTRLSGNILVNGVSKKINRYVLDNRSSLSPVTEQLCQDHRLFSRFF